MFPPFVSSFGDQITSVLINLTGTVFSGLISSIVSSIFTTIITPIMKNIAAGFGVM